jgi:hypothetical protein
LQDGTKRPPTAAEWANRTGKIPNWRVLSPNESPEPGDVAAYRIPGGGVGATGHSGIVTADPKGGVRSISAHEYRVGPANPQFIGDQRTVCRRYEGR